MLRSAYLRCPPALQATFQRLLQEESGQDLVEYSLLMVLIALGVTAAVDHLGDGLYHVFRHVARIVAHGKDRF